MPYSFFCKLLFVAALLSPVSAVAQAVVEAVGEGAPEEAARRAQERVVVLQLVHQEGREAALVAQREAA